MKKLSLCFLLSIASFGFPQGHDLKPAEAMKNLTFLLGDWTGKQDFNTGGDPMVGEMRNLIQEAIGGRYVEERLATTLPGRKASDTRHFITFDPKSQTFRAWWFNDSSAGAMELEGTLAEAKLVLLSKPTPTGNGQNSTFRATYESPAPNKLNYSLELKTGDAWQLLFKTSYEKKG